MMNLSFVFSFNPNREKNIQKDPKGLKYKAIIPFD